MWLPALAAASIIKVIMAGQRMREPARDRNGSYTALLAAEADIHPRMAMCKLRPAGDIVRPPYPQVTGAFTGRCLMRPGRWRTRGMAPPGAREHDPSGTACTGGPGRTQARFTGPSWSLT
jgi:hypothetical protein